MGDKSYNCFIQRHFFAARISQNIEFGYLVLWIGPFMAYPFIEQFIRVDSIY